MIIDVPEEKSGISWFAPQVRIDGKDYTPVGWMWVLGFAIGGCDWAINSEVLCEYRFEILQWAETRPITDDQKFETNLNIVLEKIRKCKAKSRPLDL